MCAYRCVRIRDSRASRFCFIVPPGHPADIVCKFCSADTRRCTEALESSAGFILKHWAFIGKECNECNEMLDKDRAFQDCGSVPLNLLIPLVVVVWHRIRQCKALVVEDKDVDLERWLPDFEMLMDMRTTLQNDRCLFRTQHPLRADRMVMICEQALQHIMSYTDANLRVGMCQLEEEVKKCEAATEADPLPGAVTSCTSEVIS